MNHPSTAALDSSSTFWRFLFVSLSALAAGSLIGFLSAHNLVFPSDFQAGFMWLLLLSWGVSSLTSFFLIVRAGRYKSKNYSILEAVVRSLGWGFLGILMALAISLAFGTFYWTTHDCGIDTGCS